MVILEIGVSRWYRNECHGLAVAKVEVDVPLALEVLRQVPVDALAAGCARRRLLLFAARLLGDLAPRRFRGRLAFLRCCALLCCRGDFGKALLGEHEL